MADRNGIGITMRLDDEQLAKLDRLMAKLQAGGSPKGTTVTRTMAMRHALTLGLDAALGGRK
jgi:hypothetical protein